MPNSALRQSLKSNGRNHSSDAGGHKLTLFGFTLIRVDTQSMDSTLPNGTFAIFLRKRVVVKNDVVLAEHPHFGTLVKTVAARARTGRYSLRGMRKHDATKETPASVSRSEIKGALIWQW